MSAFLGALGQGLQRAMMMKNANAKGNAETGGHPMLASLDQPGRTIPRPENYGGAPMPQRNPAFRDMPEAPMSILPPPMQGGANQAAGNAAMPPMPQQNTGRAALAQALLQAQVGKEAVPDWLPSNIPWPYR